MQSLILFLLLTVIGTEGLAEISLSKKLKTDELSTTTPEQKKEEKLGGILGIGANLGRGYGLIGISLRITPWNRFSFEGGIGYVPEFSQRLTCFNCPGEIIIGDTYQTSGKLMIGLTTSNSSFQPGIVFTGGYDPYQGPFGSLGIILDYFYSISLLYGVEFGLTLRPDAEEILNKRLKDSYNQRVKVIPFTLLAGINFTFLPIK